MLKSIGMSGIYHVILIECVPAKHCAVPFSRTSKGMDMYFEPTS
jgi:hypothetical protein